MVPNSLSKAIASTSSQAAANGAVNPGRAMGNNVAVSKRHSSPGKRTRRPNGPETLNVDPVDAPTPAELGTGHLYSHEVLGGGPRAIIAAHHEAARLSAQFGEDIEAKWCLATPWLYKLATTDRARARYALMWRPRFLAVLSITRSKIFACKSAKVSRPTVDKHCADDPDFDCQVTAAMEHCVELLHDVTMKDAIEGVCEPVFWQGIPVGHIRKFDNRLRVELLRAHMPKQFRTPGHGAGVNVNIGPGAGGTFNATTVIVDATVRDELVALRQEALRAIAEGAASKEPLKLVEATEILTPDP